MAERSKAMAWVRIPLLSIFSYLNLYVCLFFR
ncbi:hypothetical protein EYZ11_005562 [Aspergillus tanneri]|uniref:Uncharacterized protein n=1 Tax=Aspergillus tanneri TaxID=1220188 RepID=A0A4S3JK59_9EURO|nr:hypothetical protein EYZ11_005562 [Aspergillus tanneri]